MWKRRRETKEDDIMERCYGTDTGHDNLRPTRGKHEGQNSEEDQDRKER